MNTMLAFDGSNSSFYDTGVSDDANTLRQQLRSINKRGSESCVLKSARRTPDDVKEQLLELHEDYSEDGWNGYDAIGVKKSTINKAFKFLLSLPVSIELPEIDADPTGDVSLEWYRNTSRLLIVRISNLGDITYAGLFSPFQKAHGTTYFEDDAPKEILDLINRL